MKHTIEELRAWQKLPLEEKIRMTQMRIAQWYRFYEGDVYVSYSGGKDSTVLLDICRGMFDLMDAVHVNTGLEYPEIERFVADTDNVTIIKPKINLREVICKYGYPLISKEVSECVYGARKYLRSLLEGGSLSICVRANYWNRSISEASEMGNITYTSTKRTEYVELADRISKERFSRGGYDNKYRKLRGIGEYSKSTHGEQRRGQQSAACDNAGDVDERQGASDKGEYP